jgi:transcription initiation factor IIE alpha subunit
MAGLIDVCQCSRATCRHIEQYEKPGTCKCPKCGSRMVHKYDQDEKKNALNYLVNLR